MYIVYSRQKTIVKQSYSSVLALFFAIFFFSTNYSNWKNNTDQTFSSLTDCCFLASQELPENPRMITTLWLSGV